MRDDDDDDDAQWSGWRALRSPEFWALLAVGIGGAAATSIWLVAGGVSALTLLSWPGRWQKLYHAARVIDAEYRRLAALAVARQHLGLGVWLWLRGHVAAIVLTVHLANAAVFCALAFLAGRLSAWVWGVG